MGGQDGPQFAYRATHSSVDLMIVAVGVDHQLFTTDSAEPCTSVSQLNERRQRRTQRFRSVCCSIFNNYTAVVANAPGGRKGIRMPTLSVQSGGSDYSMVTADVSEGDGAADIEPKNHAGQK